MENYQKDRTVCKVCHKTITLNSRRKRFAFLEDKSSIKHVNSIKHVSSGKQTNSFKEKGVTEYNAIVKTLRNLYNAEHRNNEEAECAARDAKPMLNKLLNKKITTR